MAEHAYDIILFTPKQPNLATGDNGRYQMALSQFRQQTDGTYKITGGSAIFTITSAIQHDAEGLSNSRSSGATKWVPSARARPATRGSFR